MAFTLSGPALCVLLGLWTDPHSGQASQQPPHEEVRRTLIPLGLIDYSVEHNCYRVTQKGDAYITHLLKQPLPVEVPLVVWAYPDPTN